MAQFNPTEKFPEPATDWIPLSRAPFFYGRNYLRSLAEWQSAVERITGFTMGRSTHTVKASGNLMDRQASITAEGFTLELDAGIGELSLVPAELGSDEAWPDFRFDGPPDEFLRSLQTKTIPPEHRRAVELHGQLADSLCRNFRTNLSNAIMKGAARLMARKGSPLVEFEYIALDQWQHFTLDHLTDDQAPQKWFVPDFRYQGTDSPLHQCTATAGGGERLYSIHVAPGRMIRSEPNGSKTECLHWLIEMLKQYPDNYPGGLDAAETRACERFAGLTGRAFRSSYRDATHMTGNYNWSTPGRRSKSSQKIPAEN